MMKRQRRHQRTWDDEVARAEEEGQKEERFSAVESTKGSLWSNRSHVVFRQMPSRLRSGSLTTVHITRIHRPTLDTSDQGRRHPFSCYKVANNPKVRRQRLRSQKGHLFRIKHSTPGYMSELSATTPSKLRLRK